MTPLPDHAPRLSQPHSGSFAGRAALALALTLLLPAAAGAEEWQFTATPYLWLQGTTGDVEVRGVEAHLDDSFFDMLDSSDTLLGGFLHLEGRSAGWGFWLEGNYAYSFVEGEPAGRGSSVETGLTILETGGLVEIAGGPLGETAQWRLEALAGLRYVAFDATIELGPLEVERRNDWVDPLVGLGATLDLGERWTLIAHGDVGGFGIGSDFTANLYGLVGYRSEIFGATVLSTVGYRGFYFDREDEGRNSGADLWLHGPVLGMTFQF